MRSPADGRPAADSGAKAGKRLRAERDPDGREGLKSGRRFESF